jgi:hypothetical protein
MNALRSTSESGVERLSEILSEQNEGLTKEQWEKRLAALERIASSVRARRSKCSEPQSTPASSRKVRRRA